MNEEKTWFLFFLRQGCYYILTLICKLSNFTYKAKKTPKGVIFSDYICTFAMSFRVLFVFLQH